MKRSRGEDSGEREEKKRAATLETPSENRISLDRYTVVRKLGEGSYGKVMLASNKVTKELIAVKVINQRSLIGRMARFQTECRVLQLAASCRFLTRAHFIFQGQGHFFIAMDYLSGGDLFDYLNKHGRLEISKTRFFAAELTCGIQFLHSQGIIHRDLKPDNILLDSIEHLKIADFGLALENMTGARCATGRAGTVGYMAPEMIRGERYDAAVDWWAFGIILYQMATGNQPFYSGKTSETVESSMLQDSVFYPAVLSHALQDILEKLLQKTPSMRLGASGNIRDHPFFQPIDWVELEAGRLNPPFAHGAPPLDNASEQRTQEKQASPTPTHRSRHHQHQEQRSRHEHRHHRHHRQRSHYRHQSQRRHDRHEEHHQHHRRHEDHHQHHRRHEDHHQHRHQHHKHHPYHRHNKDHHH